MPQQVTITNIRVKNIIASLAPAVSLLKDISDAFGTPFVPAISNTTLSLMSTVQNVKKNQDTCIQLLEGVYQLLCAIVHLHIKSQPAGNIPPTILEHIGSFTQTLHKVHAFVESQQDGSRIKQFFRHIETKTLLNECQLGLREAFEVFKTKNATIVSSDLAQMQAHTDRMHKDILELISTMTDQPTSDRTSSVYTLGNSSENSSKSISMLPAKPSIFHGRKEELNHLLTLLLQDSARISILGPGGIGKTSLAKAAVHHPKIAAKYNCCFFVVAESAATRIELAALIGEHIGLQPAKDLTKQVISYFFRTGPTLLIIDNLDTVWEPVKSRVQVEEFLSKLSEIPHLALVITMRGAQRPANVHWSHPFLQPLQPLSATAARNTFDDIVDDFHDRADVEEILALTDNLPLAVDLMARAVDFEGGCSNVLVRWKTEKTSVISKGHDRRSNLDESITVSISSPRMNSEAKELLSLLGILPAGLSDHHLLQCTLPIQNILKCKSILLGTGLAYHDVHGCLKLLVPVREHVQHFYSPSAANIHQLQNYFRQLLKLAHTYPGSQEVVGSRAQLTSNVANLHQLIMEGLHSGNPNISDTIDCTIFLANFRNQNGISLSSEQHLFNRIPSLLANVCDSTLKVRFITEMFYAGNQIIGTTDTLSADALITEATVLLSTLENPMLACRLYSKAGSYYFWIAKNTSVATRYLEKALHLSKSHAAHKEKAMILKNLALMKADLGDHAGAMSYAIESYKLFQGSTDLYAQAEALDLLARCHISLGDNKTCISLYRRAIKLQELCGMNGSLSTTHMKGWLAEALYQQSEYAEARRIYSQIIAAIDQAHTLYPWTCLNIAQIDTVIGASEDDVHRNLDNAEASFNGRGHKSGLRLCGLQLGLLLLREGERVASKIFLQKYLPTSRVVANDSDVLFICLSNLGNVTDWAPADFLEAARYTVIYLVYAAKLQQKLELHKALQYLGDVFQAEDDEVTARSLFKVALEGFTHMDVHRGRAECMLRLGDLANQHGDLVKAVKHWKMARSLFEHCSQAKQIIQVDERLAKVVEGHVRG